MPRSRCRGLLRRCAGLDSCSSRVPILDWECGRRSRLGIAANVVPIPTPNIAVIAEQLEEVFVGRRRYQQGNGDRDRAGGQDDAHSPALRRPTSAAIG